MPRIVALETSGPVGSVAVAGSTDGEPAETAFERGQRHARDLMPALEELCRREGWSPESLDAVVVDVGPGSYTGVRVAVAAARTLAFAVQATLIGVDSLAVLAEGFGETDRAIAVVLDARRGQAYWDLFEPSETGRLQRRFGPGLAAPDAITSVLPDRCLVLGSGVAVHGESFASAGYELVAEGEAWVPHARTLLEIGRRAYLAGERPDPAAAGPIYLRPSEAELLWEERHGKKS